MSDQELSNCDRYLTILMAERDNRLREVKKRHKIFDFQSINPAFIAVQKEIETELNLRKARG